jgi:ureidoacrylate peracid hydrolase
MPASPFLSTISRDIPILPDRAALLFIDGQNFSCHPDGAEWRGMSPEERAEKKDPFLRQLREDLFPKMQALQRAARAAGVEVMYTTTERLTKDGRNRCLGGGRVAVREEHRAAGLLRTCR